MADEPQAPAPEETSATERSPKPSATEESPRPVAPEILAMESALDRGDHVETARLAAELSRSDEPKLRDAGLAMRERLRPDPVVVAVFVATGFVLAALTLAWAVPS